MPIESLENLRTLLEQRQRINANFSDLDGRLTAVEEEIEDILSTMLLVNKRPTVIAGELMVNDVSNRVGINMLVGASDPDNNTLRVVSVRHGDEELTLGAESEVPNGILYVDADGYFLYTPNVYAGTLRQGQTRQELYQFTATDGQGAMVSSTVTVTIVGQNNSPIVTADVGRAPHNRPCSGNVLTNDRDPDQGSLLVNAFSVVDHSPGLSTAGTVVNMDGIGSLFVNTNGAWQFTPVNGYSGNLTVRVLVQNDQALAAESELRILVAGPAANVISHPVTTAKSPVAGGSRYDVFTNEDANEVPWGALGPDDVVNVHRGVTGTEANPYRFCIGLRGSGTLEQPIQIWGVTDVFGNRPEINWSDNEEWDEVFTAEGTNVPGPSGNPNLYTPLNPEFPQYNEWLGGIVIRRGLGDPNLVYVPKHIQICNLRIKGTNGHGTRRILNGTVGSWDSAGFWILGSEDILLQNNWVTGCNNGLLAQINYDVMQGTSQRLILRNNIFHDNGVTGSFFEHNVYNQGYSTIVEGNYFGPLKPGAIGCSYKDRQGNGTIRYNYFVATGSGRTMDLVHAENGREVRQKPDYADSFVYGNVFVNTNVGGASHSFAPIHMGGDAGQQEGGTIEFFPADEYRTRFRFWNNTVYCNVSGANLRVHMFDLSLRTVTVDCWNNLFVLRGNATYSWVRDAGIVNLRGRNILCMDAGNAMADGWVLSNPINWKINLLGTLERVDVTFIDEANGDFHLPFVSPAIDTGAGAPPDLGIDIDNRFPMEYQPRMRANGLVVREITGPTIDVGATEYGVGYTPPPPPVPENTTPPYIKGNRVAGGVMEADVGEWTGRPGFTIEWLDVENDNEVLAVGANLSSTEDQTHDLVALRVTGANAAGSEVAVSAPVRILSVDAPVTTGTPSVVGTLIANSLIQINVGPWTNATSYSLFVYSDGILQEDLTVTDTTSTLIPVFLPTELGFKPIYFVVQAHRIGDPLDTNEARTATATCAGAALDPDEEGTFHFERPNGTTLAAMNAGWLSSNGGTTKFECVDGYLRSVAGTGTSGYSVYRLGYGNDQYAKVRVKAGWIGSLTLNVQVTDSQPGYNFVVNSSTWGVYRDGAFHTGGSHGVSAAIEREIEASVNGGVYVAKLNGTVLLTIDDSAAPITGGGIGFSLVPGSDVSKLQLEYLRTQPEA